LLCQISVYVFFVFKIYIILNLNYILHWPKIAFLIIKKVIFKSINDKVPTYSQTISFDIARLCISLRCGEEITVKLICLVEDQVAIMRIESAGVICLEKFKLFQQMDRFTLRDESKY